MSGVQFFSEYRGSGEIAPPAAEPVSQPGGRARRIQANSAKSGLALGEQAERVTQLDVAKFLFCPRPALYQGCGQFRLGLADFIGQHRHLLQQVIVGG